MHYRYCPLNQDLIAEIAVSSVLIPSFLSDNSNLNAVPNRVSLWFCDMSQCLTLLTEESQFVGFLQLSEDVLPENKIDVSYLFNKPEGYVFACKEPIPLIPGSFQIRLAIDSDYNESVYELSEATGQCKYSKSTAKKIIVTNADTLIHQKSDVDKKFSLCTKIILPQNEVIQDRLYGLVLLCAIALSGNTQRVLPSKQLLDSIQQIRTLVAQYQTDKAMQVGSARYSQTSDLINEIKIEWRKIEKILPTVTAVSFEQIQNRWLDTTISGWYFFNSISHLRTQSIEVFNPKFIDLLSLNTKEDVINFLTNILGAERSNELLKRYVLNWLIKFQESHTSGDNKQPDLWYLYAKSRAEFTNDLPNKSSLTQLEIAAREYYIVEQSEEVKQSFAKLISISPLRSWFDIVKLPIDLAQSEQELVKVITNVLINYRTDWTSKEKKTKGWKTEDKIDLIKQIQCSLQDPTLNLAKEDIDKSEEQLINLITDCQNQFREYTWKPLTGYSPAITNLAIFLMHPIDLDSIKRKQDSWNCPFGFIGQVYHAAFLGYSALSGFSFKPFWDSVASSEALNKLIFSLWHSLKQASLMHVKELSKSENTNQGIGINEISETHNSDSVPPVSIVDPSSTPQKSAEEIIVQIMSTKIQFTKEELKNLVQEERSDITDSEIFKVFDKYKKTGAVKNSKKKNGHYDIFTWMTNSLF